MPFTLALGANAGSAAVAAAVAADAAIIAAGTSAYTQHQQGKAAEQQAKFNAELAEREAQTTKEASEYEERQSRIEARQLRARQFLQFAKGGVVPTAGTPLLMQQETAAEQARDIAMQKYQYGLQTTRHISEAKLQRMMGRSQSRAGRWQAGGSLLTGTYRAASVYTE